MALKSMISVTAVVIIVSLQLLAVYSDVTNKCLAGKYHKKTPSKESAAFAECHAWKNKSCCTAELTIELSKHRVENLWNFTWNHCSNLSQACEKYLKNEECFFQCEPNLIKWHLTGGYVKGVPICSKYCDDWFDACQHDMTCVEDWLNDFNFSASVYSCPKHSKCQTFAQFYKNAEGLCNKMWGPSFKYEKSSNCMLMDFKGANPNDKVEVNPKAVASCVMPSWLPALTILLAYKMWE